MGKGKGLSYLYIMTAVVLWGISFIWTNSLIVQGVPVLVFMTFRIAIAAAVLLFIAFVTGQFVKVERKDVKWFVLLAMCEPFLYFIGESFGIQATESPTLSSVIIATIPIFTMIMAQMVYRENIRGWNIVGVLITLPGVFMMAYTDGGFTAKYAWGIALLFLAVFSSVAYAVVVKKLADRYNALTITAVQFAIGALFFLPLMLVFNWQDIDFALLCTADVLMPLLALAVLCSSLCFVCYVKSLQQIGLTRASIFTSLIPGFTAVFAYLMGQETFTPLQILGVMVVVAGVILTQK